MNTRQYFKDILKIYHIRREKPQFWHFPEQQFGYIQIPKVATRSIREALNNSSGIPSCPDGSFDQFEETYSQHITQDQIRPLAGSNFIFAFVRHPQARLYSAYVNKIIDAEKQGARNILSCHGIRYGISFTAFVDRVCAIPDRNIDRHLRSQAWFLCDSNGALIPNSIGHLETFDDDWKKLCARIPALGPSPHKNKAAHGHDFSSAYTAKTEELVRARYALDFKLFGY